ncbi:MAG: hypothetical protein ABR498_00535 [Candidatus Dormibacteria bacterium]
MSVTPAEALARPRSVWRRRRRLGLAVIAVAIIVIAVAFVVGVLGLFANPVRSVNGDGTTTLQGTFEPYTCNPTSCNGYIQAGARSVFVQFPNGCPAPARAAQLTVTARAAPDLGSASYRATACA